MTRYSFFFVLAMSMANLIAYAGSDGDSYIRIARISYMEGNVSFQHTSDVDWTAATINLPLQPGDRIYTGPQGRAEIQFDEGSVYRLAEGTDIQFLSLGEDLIQVRIMTGLSSLTVSSSTTFEMDTPAAAFIVLRRGLYRFDTRDNGDTDAIVRKGELETVSHRFVRSIESGEQIFVTADENSSYNIARYSNRDAWDEWNDRRDADFIARTSRSHLPSTVYVGASDLDRHGRWVSVESYGVAWVPYSVGVTWSPYSVGRWCYRPAWGWTWVSYEPWGWLPYHYGRWYRSARFGWCWLPGPSFSFNFWSPGLVTFYYGPSWVSWCPLGPGDYYSINNYHYNHRLYRHDLASLRRLHTRAPGHSINRNVRGAFRTVDTEHFRNGGSRAIATREGYRRIEQPWNRGTLVRERLAVQPTSKSFSADPDRKVVRSGLTNPRPAVVQHMPSAKSATRNGYVRIKNPEATSRAVARVRSGSVSRSDDTGRESDSGQGRVLRNTQSESVGSAKTQSAGSTVPGNQPERRIINSNNRSSDVGSNQSSRNSVKAGENRSATQTYSQDNSISRRDRSPTVRSTVPHDSTGTSSGGSTSARRATRNDAQPSPPVSRIQSSPLKSSSTSRESIRTNRSYSQPGVSRSSDSNSRTRSYSTPSSSSRAQSYSAPSSGRSSSTKSSSAPSSGKSSNSSTRKARKR
ncbi:MAG: FecR domain-containing protein [Acidobacteria bacterium]|nr:FecR domain-containing protein [Acidobacteriota bacterium]